MMDDAATAGSRWPGDSAPARPGVGRAAAAVTYPQYPGRAARVERGMSASLPPTLPRPRFVEDEHLSSVPKALGQLERFCSDRLRLACARLQATPQILQPSQVVLHASRPSIRHACEKGELPTVRGVVVVAGEPLALPEMLDYDPHAGRGRPWACRCRSCWSDGPGREVPHRDHQRCQCTIAVRSARRWASRSEGQWTFVGRVEGETAGVCVWLAIEDILNPEGMVTSAPGPYTVLVRWDWIVTAVMTTEKPVDLKSVRVGRPQH